MFGISFATSADTECRTLFLSVRKNDPGTAHLKKRSFISNAQTTTDSDPTAESTLFSRR